MPKLRNVCCVVSWGIKWAVAFILFYQLVFAVAFRFTPGEVQHFYVPTDNAFTHAAEYINRIIADYPTPLGEKALEMELGDPFLQLLLYVPLISSVQYFLLGCAFGIWRMHRKSAKCQ